MSLKKIAEKWITQFPLDVWWRRKNKVPFGSPQHREMSLFSMKMEYEEDLMFKEMEQAEIKKHKYKEEGLFPDIEIGNNLPSRDEELFNDLEF